ncbi:sensor histidine kinase [Acrocarpospora catenulata]|uniref:sensor histidine kinase n=1 Tax=Acrocarpospora catenulata TaxID=2836182 RepID=UPI001BDACCD1|nr:ATP-binding protein [Acrocarpospora catenulata]
MAHGVRLLGSTSRAPARAALNRVTARCAAVMRGVIGVVSSVAGLLSIGPPVTPAWLLPVVGAVLAWTTVFSLTAWRHGLTVWLISGEILLVSGLCLAQGQVVAGAVLAGGSSWVAGLVTMTIVAISLAWPPPAAVLGGLVVTVAHLVGAQSAGAADDGLTGAVINVVQVVATAALGGLLRNASAKADILLAQLRDFERRATVEQERRTDERAQNSRMHGSFLATLMVVGAGGIPASTPMLRTTATAHLAELERIAQSTEPEAELVALDERVRAVIDRAQLTVARRLAPVTVPWRVAEAFAEAVAEALANVHRHAGTDSAEVRLSDAEGGVWVEVVDRGVGFDHAAVPDHRYGLRVSIVDRLAAVGGTATVASGADGTRIALRWSP